MKKLQFLLGYIWIVQIVLWIMALFFPMFFIETVMKFWPVAPEVWYTLAMFAWRLLVFWVLMFIIAKKPEENILLIKAMIAIQVIDLISWLYYTASWIVPLAASGIALFDATIFIILLSLWKPKCKK